MVGSVKLGESVTLTLSGVNVTEPYGYTTVEDGYPLTVGLNCNVTGTVSSFVLKQTRSLSIKIP